MEYSKEKQIGKTNRKKCKKKGCQIKINNDQDFCALHTLNNQKKNISQRSKWIKKLDSVFSVFIRLRDTNKDGFGKCISSGKRIWYFVNDRGKVVSNCDNGHFENRSKMCLRYSFVNCNAQSRSENRFNEGNKNMYERGLRKKYNDNIVNVLISTAKIQKCDFSVVELKAMYQKMEDLVKKELSKKNWWHNQVRQKKLYK